MESINLHIYPSSFTNESRILRETESLSVLELFDKIIIAAIWKRGLKEQEYLGSKREVWRIRLLTDGLADNLVGKIIKYGEWMLKIILKLRKRNITVVNCHSLSVMPLGMVFKIFFKSKIIYDAHELETERSGLLGTKKRMAKAIEKITIRYADAVIVVSGSIGQWYKDRYGLKEIYVIRNIPGQFNGRCERSNILKEKFLISDGAILYIYQGVLGAGRGIKILLDVFSRVGKDKHIVFMGYGILEDTVKKFANNFPNIHFQIAVDPNDVIIYSSGADVGIALIENISLSYFYSLPNKLFEYILSGLPVIASDFPEMSKVIDENDCGWKVSVNDDAVMDLIESISLADIEMKRNNAIKFKNNFSWHEEEKKLLEVYRNLFAETTYQKVNNN